MAFGDILHNIGEEAHLVELLSPAADAGGRTSSYISLKNYSMCHIIVHITQGNAATVLLTPMQATVVAGTDGKVLTKVVRIRANLDCAASDTLAVATPALNYTTDAGVKHKIVVFEMEPQYLDVNSNFDCIAVSTGASNADNITQAYALLSNPRYTASTPPTALTN